MTISKKNVGAWDLEYAHLKWGGIAEWTWAENHLKTGDLILDAGSGEGRYLRHFCLNYNCVGIDISKNALIRSMEIIDERAEKESNSNLKFTDLNPSDSNIPDSNTSGSNTSGSNTSGSNISSLNASDSPISKPDHIVSNVAELPFSDESFDGVLCLGVLQHLF
ncbi:MAG: methyltransferase domain-containing protein [Methanimicrococcus sp.]|nr:methyltransferase domain-containing protein [Methanimicrococcus sp.]